tara:strand:+ start:1010 stop:2113 length:1104 start_codon:yes stop_codon:yes gene_type:complete
MEKKQLKITFLEPYDRGSHRYWMEIIQKYSKHQINHFSMKGYHWKWRMNGGAVTLSRFLNEKKELSDLFVASSMLDVASLRGLLRSDLRKVPILLYFHENQMGYPKSSFDQDCEKNRDSRYAWINITSLMAADAVWFNSNFHKNEFYQNGIRFLNRMRDYKETDFFKEKMEKTRVVPIAIENEFLSIPKKKSKIPVILWNHRWEEDKGIKTFLNWMIQLKKEGVDFHLILLGDSSRSDYQSLVSSISDRILFQGYTSSKEEYWSFLKKSDFLPVTSHHDYFGMSVVEAILSEVVPLLPDRLTYPEHVLTKECFYTDEREGYQKLKNWIVKNNFPEKITHRCKEYLAPQVVFNYDHSWTEIVDRLKKS